MGFDGCVEAVWESCPVKYQLTSDEGMEVAAGRWAEMYHSRMLVRLHNT